MEFTELPDDTKRDLLLLTALQCAGVDNWDGYDNAIEIYEELLQEANLSE
jgi:hypothetical protein